MITVYKNNSARKYFTLSDVADAIGTKTNVVWYRVYRAKSMPTPGKIPGRQRAYFNEETFAQIVAEAGK
ncbi:hypothetical protein [Fimbriiglobus ruber]|uniref:HTH merR-type domain-containing protein n=1 Tax=Fimbriiglobus ruber TaxID=1908690 RepID=A0A225EB40_9BACT|nr:hypothetical protein [Fimbriiglobus ruber]OWK46599.1 hypothetical protein FRUB_00298 [Fimbriiglobus ruber]